MHSNDICKDPTVVEEQVQTAYLECFPKGDRGFVPKALRWATQCFTGQYADYQPVDAHYHDFEHTLQGTLCMARLLRGRHRAGAVPQVSEPMLQLGLLAILMHDTGYLKKRADREGTGAKYTVTHVDRSAEFAGDFLRSRGYGPKEVQSVQNMIRCTGLDVNLQAIPFQSEQEKIVGFALGTADLLGQMAAGDYVEKLPVLYSEFAEAVQFSHSRTHFIAHFASARQLMEETPRFWEATVRKKLDEDFEGVWRFLNDPYPHGSNAYFERIDANMRRLKEVMAA